MTLLHNVFITFSKSSQIYYFKHSGVGPLADVAHMPNDLMHAMPWQMLANSFSMDILLSLQNQNYVGMYTTCKHVNWMWACTLDVGM